MPISIAGSGTITGISAGGLPDDCITTADIAAGAVTPAKTTGGPAFSAYQSSAHSATNGVNTKVQFQTEQFDTANCFDSATNYRFTPNVAGYYQVNAAVAQVTASQTELALYLFKNGSAARLLQNNITPAARQVAGSTLIYMNGSTDYLEIYIYTSITSNLATGSTWFDGFLARPA